MGQMKKEDKRVVDRTGFLFCFGHEDMFRDQKPRRRKRTHGGEEVETEDKDRGRRQRQETQEFLSL